jgi:trimeric autotransporter adhesin
MKNRSNLAIFTTMLSVLACIGLAYGAGGPESPDPSPFPVNSNTADGYRALENSGNNFNSAFGWFSLFNNTDAAFNSGFGAGTLFFNNGTSNTAVGAAALFFNTTGANNSAVGVNALRDNDTGGANNAVGAFALFSNTTASFNNAHGRNALTDNTTGIENNAVGDLALSNNTTGCCNVGIGDNALLSQTTANSNVAVGKNAGEFVTTAAENTFIGRDAGTNITNLGGNIYVGVRAGVGVGNEVAFIRIGEVNPPIVYDTFIKGIFGRAVAAGALSVIVDSNGKLGTVVSSRRFKHDIKPMDKASEAILALKPVTYHYNRDNANEPQFGLVAEEVEAVNPDLVVYDECGEPLSVRYDAVNAMLLNEFIKEHKKVEAQQASISQLKSEMQTMVAQLKEQAAQIQKVSAQVEMNKPATKVVRNQ